VAQSSLADYRHFHHSLYDCLDRGADVLGIKKSPADIIAGLPKNIIAMADTGQKKEYKHNRPERTAKAAICDTTRKKSQTISSNKP